MVNVIKKKIQPQYKNPRPDGAVFIVKILEKEKGSSVVSAPRNIDLVVRV